MSDHVRPYPDSTRNKKWPVLPSAQAPLLPVPEIIKLTEDFHCHNMMTWRQHLGYYVDDHFQETSALEKAKPSSNSTGSKPPTPHILREMSWLITGGENSQFSHSPLWICMDISFTIKSAWSPVGVGASPVLLGLPFRSWAR